MTMTHPESSDRFGSIVSSRPVRSRRRGAIVALLAGLVLIALLVTGARRAFGRPHEPAPHALAALHAATARADEPFAWNGAAIERRVQSGRRTVVGADADVPGTTSGAGGMVAVTADASGRDPFAPAAGGSAGVSYEQGAGAIGGGGSALYSGGGATAGFGGGGGGGVAAPAGVGAGDVPAVGSGDGTMPSASALPPAPGGTLGLAEPAKSTPVSAVPEPASWLLLIGGLAALGSVLRRGRRTAAAVRTQRI